jgi:hypothetical protein
MNPPARLAAALRAHAQGLYCPEAAAELLISQSWLHRADFTSQFVRIQHGLAGGPETPPSTGRPRSPPWEPACLAPAASSAC